VSAGLTSGGSSFSLVGQTALVTGASRGIGAAIAKRLAEAGATVILNYKTNQEAAEKVLTQIKNISPLSELSQFDIAKAEEVDAAIDGLTKKFESIPILVCNAGISRDALLPRSTDEHFLEVLQTNLVGTMRMVRALSRSMMRNRYGRIICLSSIVGETGNKGQSAYAASKSALFGFAKSVALELASRGITCNLVAPGFIETEMTQQLDETVQKTYFDRIPSARFGTAEEVAACVQFLASKEAGYITGATIDINGGLLMR
jgi:3-oxoacyl-[acyl-carrier protein] reductase